MPAPRIGMVEVAGKVFTIEFMSFRKEFQLGLLQRQLFEKQNGSPYARLKPMLEEMAPQDRSEAVAQLTRAKIANDLPGADARELARSTKEGVALELWMRARGHHPGLKQEEIQAIITDVNCMDVLADIENKLFPPEEGDDSKS